MAPPILRKDLTFPLTGGQSGCSILAPALTIVPSSLIANEIVLHKSLAAVG